MLQNLVIGVGPPRSGMVKFESSAIIPGEVDPSSFRIQKLIWTRVKTVVADLQREAPVHLLWLDLGFDGDYNGHKSLPEIERTFPALPVIVVSDILAKETMSKEGLEIARELVRFPQVKAFVSANDLAAKIVFDVDRILGTPLWLRDDDLWILHFSDVQFGGAALTEAPGILVRKLAECLESFVQSSAAVERFELPSVAFVTGDLTERGRPAEFALARVFLEGVAEQIFRWSPKLAGALGKTNIIVVPGNHDVNWDISRARNLHLDTLRDGKKTLVYRDGAAGMVADLEYLWRYTWQPCLECLQSFDGTPAEWLWDPGFNVINRTGELGIVIVQVNSARWGTTHVQQDAGVPAELWQRIRTQLAEADPAGTAMRLLLVHHAVAETERPEDRLKVGKTFNVQELVGTLSRTCHFAAVFTGHIHNLALQPLDTGSDARRLIAIGAGTLMAEGTRAYEQPSFNLVRLGPRSHGRFEAITTYPFIWDGSRFTKRAAFEDGMEWFRREELRY